MPQALSKWSPQKVAVVEKAFWSFARHVRVNSKERGGNYAVVNGLYLAQKRFIHAVFHEALAHDKHTVKWLKRRQLGITTVCEIFDVFWLGIHDGMQGAIIYDTASHSASGRIRIKNIIKHLPKSYAFPRVIGDNREGLLLENDSRLIFMSAGIRQTSSSGVLGRSEGLNYWHRSELCSWENEEGVKSLNSSKSNTYPDRLYLDESTARNYGMWYDIWKAGKENDLEEVTGFAGWWAKDDQRWERGSPHYQRYGLDPPSDEELKRIVVVKEKYDYEIDDEQLAWYRWFVDPSREREEEDAEDSYVISDQPWTEEEAFQQAGSTFYRSDRLQQASAFATTARYQSFRFWPGNTIVDCDMRPARYLREVELKLWEEPVGEAVYVVSGDPAFGHNEANNNSCAQVARCYADGWEQVCEYTSATIEPHHFAWLLWTLVSYYGGPTQNIVLMICEINGPGEEVWRQYEMTRTLIRDGYMRSAARELGIGNVGGNVRNYVYTRSDSMHVGHSYQFRTQQQLKVQLMEGFRNNFHNGIAVVRSMPAIEEMKTITREGDKIGAAQSSGRDDMNFALALANRGWEERLRRMLVRENRTREADKIKRSASLVDRVSLFNRNMLGEFFKVKERQRTQTRIASRQRSRW